MSRIVGIDFGTSNSSVAFHDGKSAQIIEMADGSRLLPSIIAFDQDNDVLVGAPAAAVGKLAPLKCFRHIKRLMGTVFNRVENVNSQVVEGDDGFVALKGPDKTYRPQQFGAVLFATLLDAAEAQYDERPDGVVVGVPAGFKDPQRAAIREAAEIAGIAPDRIWLMAEPVLAAIMYAQGRKKFSTIAVYDWGGGTFDFTLLRCKEGKLEVIGTRGNATLGGKDVDEILVRHCVRFWKEKTGADLGLHSLTMARIREHAEGTKIDLTGNPRSAVRVDYVSTDGGDGIQHMNVPITREEFEGMARSTVEETFIPCRELMAEYAVTPAMLDEVILVGGMTRMPLVHQMVEKEFGKKPSSRVSVTEAVALGAATYAAVAIERRGGEDFLLKDKATHTLAVETLGDIPFVVIKRGEALPAERVVQLTTSKDNAAVVGFHLLEGDSDKASRNSLLVRDYPEVSPGAAGDPTEEYRVRREVDSSIHVTHLGSGRVVYSSKGAEPA